MSDTGPMAPGIYVHVPFCATVCPYCDFAVQTGRAPRRARWVEALRQEIDRVGALGEWSAHPFDTIYIGGGTPSQLSPAQLEAILGALGSALPVAPGARVFLEANPEDVTAQVLASWRALGVATLSLGVQSFDDDRLRWLGRRHSAAQAQAAVERALAAGFETVSLDLIYGLPGETGAALATELAAAIALAPDHLSAYQLSMPEGTPFGRRRERGELTELAEPAQAERFIAVHETLAAHGFAAYELSNFARAPHHRSRHNQKYWTHTPYLGIGPAAHSFDGGRRWWNDRDADVYEQRLGRGERPVAGQETLSPADLALERVMLGLRTAGGVPASLCDAVAAEALGADGLVERVDGRIACTLRGWAVADSIAARLACRRPAREGE